MTGEKHPHWLEMLGFTRFKKQTAHKNSMTLSCFFIFSSQHEEDILVPVLPKMRVF